VSAGHHQLGTDDHTPQQEQLNQLQQQVQDMHGQMEEILGRIQQTTQHVQSTQQQMKDDIHTTIQQTNLSVQQLGQRFEEAQQREENLQTSQQQLQKQIEDSQQKMQQLDQELQDSHQQTQVQVRQQLKEAMDKIQQMDQQAQHSQQQYEKWQQLMREMEKVGQDQDHLSQKAFDQYLYAQHRVRLVLATPPQDKTFPLFPRLFIILPETTAVAGGQERCSLQFRFYFLCECLTHPLPRDYSNPHQVHLTNHPGYKLENQEKFIDKFGSYLLTMMYMVKYGARVGGLVAPPLLGLNHAIVDDEDQGHLKFIKNFGGLVDDAITHLQAAISRTGGHPSTPQMLEANDFNELKTHPNFKEHIHGDLSSITIEKLHYTSVCCEHLRDCYTSALVQLKLDIMVNGGAWKGVETRIIAPSEAMTKLSNDTIGKVLKIQDMKRWPSLTEITLKQNGVHPAATSTNDIFGVLNDLDYLSLDIGRLWMTTNNIAKGEIKNPSIRIIDLRGLTLDDLKFIQQHRPIALRILKTPEKEDENRLISILRQNPSLVSIVIGCHMGRYVAVINMVKSTIDGMRRNGGRPAISSFILADPSPVDSARDEMLQRQSRLGSMMLNVSNSGNSVGLMFNNESSTLGIRSDLRSNQFRSDDLAARDFLLQYGYSIVTLVVPESFGDHPAMLLDECTEKYFSSIARLDITPTSLTTTGLDAMNRIIKRSKLTYLRLFLKDLRQGQQLEKAMLLLERYKDPVTSVHVSLWCEESCLSRIKRVLPDRSSFPRLEEFSVDCINWNHGLRDIARQWIISMISGRTPSGTSLKVVGMKIHFQPQDWEAVIEAIDFSTLQELHFDNCNFSQVQLKLLADRIADSKAMLLPLKLLNLKGSKAERVDDAFAMRAMFVRIEQKAPQVIIEGQFRPG